MVRLPKLLLPVVLAGIFGLCSSFDDFSDREWANSNSLVNLNRGMQAFGFRTQEQWDSLSAKWVQPYYAETFSPGLFTGARYMIYPYWQGQLYENYFFDKIARIGYLGYMIDPFSGNPALTYSWTVPNVTEFAKLNGTSVDLVLYCSGEKETDLFLTSDSAKKTCIANVMAYAFKRDSLNPSLSYNADGINVFFPDFNFEKKREFGLFIKDLCWAFWKCEALKKRDTTELILTFPLRDTIYRDYVDGLFQYVDEVYYADFDYRGVMRDTVSTMAYRKMFIDGINRLSFMQKLISEIRLAYVYNPFTEEAKFGETWVPYLLAIILILLVILVAVVAALFWGRFNQFVTENRSAVFLVGALLLTEVVFLFIFMVEKMNYTIWLINTNNPGAHYFLLIPAILVFIFPVIRILQRQRRVP